LRVVLALLLTAVLVAPVVLVGYMWPRDDRPRDPDAVVVLGGGGAERAALGLELAERHDATLVLASSARFYAAREGVTCDSPDVICFEPDPPTTIGEARNVADLATEWGWSHVTVATSRFHTSRSRLVFRQCLGRDGATVVGATGPHDPPFALDRELRETLGTLASWTIEPAC
jgi:uncharacterized SAM-binding protein YcdF (DUF218 family)